MRLKRGGWPFSGPPNCDFELNTNSPQADGLAAWWPTLKQSGTNSLRDFSGRGIPALTFTGPPTWQTNPVVGGYLDFGTAANQFYAEVDDIPAGLTPPFSMSCWFFYASTVTGDNCMMWVGNSGAHEDYFALLVNTQSSPYYVQADIVDGPTYITVSATAGLPVGTFGHAAVVFWTDSLRYVYFNGGNRGVNTTTASPDGINRTSIGRFADASPTRYLGGGIADARIYNRGLSDAEVQELYQNPWELYKPRVPLFVAAKPPAAGRTTYNTDSHPLGIQTGMGWRIGNP